MAFTPVAKTADLPEGEGKTAEVRGRKIAVFNVGGEFHALDNVCLHRGGPLGEGDLNGTVVTCPWHGWEFDVTSGQCLTAPGEVKKYEVRVEDDQVLVDL